MTLCLIVFLKYFNGFDMNPEKKISFGFNKLGKKPIAIINKPQEKKVDYIVCLEESSIKLKHEPKEIDKGPLVIPLKDNQKDLLDRIRHMKAKQINITNVDNEKAEDTRPDSELTIEELATREVIRDAQLKLQQTVTKDNKTFVVPLKKEDEVVFDGEKESTLTDYENIPVNDFGLAMLRGMGWKEGIGIGKNPSKAAVKQAPELRPKGLGLGANPASSDKQQPVCDKDGQVLILKRGSYAKVVAGGQKGIYCEVQGLDDEAGRVVVKTSLKGEIMTFNEFMLVPITKEEYSRNSKVINSAKFNEYKEMEKVKIKTEIKSENNDEYFSNSKDNNKNSDTKSTSKERNKNYNAQVKSEGSHSSDEAYSKDTKGKDKSKKCDDSSDLNSEDDRRSRRIHKRKDKRRHRDKSRSPNRSKPRNSRKSSKSKHRYRSSSDSDYERKSKPRSRKSSNSDDDRYKRKNKR